MEQCLPGVSLLCLGRCHNMCRLRIHYNMWVDLIFSPSNSSFFRCAPDMAAAKECKIQESKRTQDALCSHFGQESFYRCAFLCAVTTIGMPDTPIVITGLWHRCVKKWRFLAYFYEEFGGDLSSASNSSIMTKARIPRSRVSVPFFYVSHMARSFFIMGAVLLFPEY